MLIPPLSGAFRSGVNGPAPAADAPARSCRVSRDRAIRSVGGRGSAVRRELGKDIRGFRPSAGGGPDAAGTASCRGKRTLCSEREPLTFMLQDLRRPARGGASWRAIFPCKSSQVGPIRGSGRAGSGTCLAWKARFGVERWRVPAQEVSRVRATVLERLLWPPG